MIISISGYAGSGKDTAGRIIQCLTAGYSTEYTIKALTKDTGVLTPFIDETPWQIKKWATALRKCAAILLGMDEQFLYTEEFKNMILPECWWYTKVVHSNGVPTTSYIPYNVTAEEYGYGNGINTIISQTKVKMTGRMFLQQLGTDAVRDGLHPNAWVNSLMAEYSLGSDIAKKLVLWDAYEKDLPNWIITDTRFPNELAAIKERGGVCIRINRDMYLEIKDGSTMRCAHNPSFDMYHPSETALDNATFDYVIDNNGTIEELVEKLRNVLSWILPPKT